MGGRMVAHERMATVPVDDAVDSIALLERSLGFDLVGYLSTELADVDDPHLPVVVGHHLSGVVGLTSARGVERGPVQHYELTVGYTGYCGIELLEIGVIKVEHVFHGWTGPVYAY